MSIHEGFIQSDDGRFFVQIRDENARFGFRVLDDEQSYEVPPFKTWKAVAIDEVPEDDRERLRWILED